MFKKAGLSIETPIRIYQEKTPYYVEQICCPKDIPLMVAINELQDGVILLFESADTKLINGNNVVEHFNDLSQRIKLVFINVDILDDDGFTLELSLKMNYTQMVTAVAEHLGEDLEKLIFFKSQNDGPRAPLSKHFSGSIKHFLHYLIPNSQNKVYYQLINL